MIIYIYIYTYIYIYIYIYMSIYLRRRLRLSMCCTSYVWKNNTVLRIILRALRLRITSRFPKWAVT